MRILQLDTLAELATQRLDWEALFDRCPAPTPAQTYAWTHAFLQHALTLRQRWLCLFAYEQDALVGTLPLILDRRWGVPGLALQRFKGLFDPFHTVGADALIAPGRHDVLPAFVQHLRQRFHALPSITLLRVAPAISAPTDQAAGRTPGLSLIERPADREAFIRLNTAKEKPDDGPEAAGHHQRFRPKFRRDIHRQARQLQEISDIRYRLHEQTWPNAESLRRFAEIEDSGWKGAEGTSLRQHGNDLAVFEQATEAFADLGWMEWSFLDAGGEPIAGQLGVRIHQRLFLWKVAYREDYNRYAPSNLLLYQLLASLAERPDIQELNFMNDRAWLRPFRPDTRERVDRFLFPAIPGLASLLRSLLALKQRLRQRHWR